VTKWPEVRKHDIFRDFVEVEGMQVLDTLTHSLPAQLSLVVVAVCSNFNSPNFEAEKNRSWIIAVAVDFRMVSLLLSNVSGSQVESCHTSYNGFPSNQVIIMNGAPSSFSNVTS
jgi:hypothetical protein